MIELLGLRVGLGGSPVLEGIDLFVAPGTWTSVIGPNGSGKTTLLKAVAGLIPHSGEVLVNGSSTGSIGRRELARLVSYVPQDPVVPPEMTVKDYVLLGRTPYIAYLGTENRQDRVVAASVLDRTCLDLFANRRIGTLSGGEQQRAVVARALAQEATVLLLDEPTTGMDIGYQQQILELVDSLRLERRLTVLAAIHDLTLAGQYSDRLLLIDSGRSCSAGTPEEVLTEELILKHYGTPVRIVNDPADGIAVLPRRGVQ